MSNSESATNKYQQFLGIEVQQDPPDYYTLLAISPLESNESVINTAAKSRAVQLGAMKTPENEPVLREMLQEIIAAKQCLTNPIRRADYERLYRLRNRAGTSTPEYALPNSFSAPVQPSTEDAPAFDASQLFSKPADSAPQPAATEPSDFFGVQPSANSASQSAVDYIQPGLYTQPGAAAQPGLYTQPGATAQPGLYTQPGVTAQPGLYTQPGAAAQPGLYTQPGAVVQPGLYTQPGAVVQPGLYTQPGAVAQPGLYTQPGVAAQPGLYTQPGAAAQPGLYTQPGAVNPMNPGAVGSVPGTPPVDGFAFGGAATGGMPAGFAGGTVAGASAPGAARPQSSKTRKKAAPDKTPLILGGIGLFVALVIICAFISGNSDSSRAYQMYIEAQSCVNARDFDGGRKYIEQALALDRKDEYVRYREQIDIREAKYEKAQRHKAAREEEFDFNSAF